MGTEQLGQLAQAGILGLLLSLAIIALIYKDREAKTERDGRIKDLKDMLEADGIFRTEIKNFMQNIRDMLTQRKV